MKLTARALAIGVLLGGPLAAQERPVVVASKPFGESYLLCEMFAQLLEARGVPVDRRPGLGATDVAFRALRAGAIDVYPEYTGTGLLAILGESPRGNASDVYRRVASEFRRRYRRALVGAARISEHICDRRASRHGRFAPSRNVE